MLKPGRNRQQVAFNRESITVRSLTRLYCATICISRSHICSVRRDHQFNTDCISRSTSHAKEMSMQFAYVRLTHTPAGAAAARQQSGASGSHSTLRRPTASIMSTIARTTERPRPSRKDNAALATGASGRRATAMP